MYRVLLVDDEMWMRKGIVSSLDWEEYGFIIAGEAANGKEALEIINKGTIHLVLADLRMPVMDGMQLMEALNLRKSVIPLVTVITGLDDFAFAQKALRLGAFDYLLKPVESEDLLENLVRSKEYLQLNQYYEIEEPAQFNREISSKTVERVRAYILNHFEDPISLTQLAEMFSMNPAYLSSLFHQETGYTFINYLIHLRLARAKELLLSTDLPVATVASKVGYPDNKHFYKSFKKWVGYTPLEFRERTAK